MKANMSLADRVIRIAAVIVIAVLYFTDQISGTLAIILGIVAAIFVLTSLVSFCPLYRLFGISTIKRNKYI
ncbi:MAG: DUF2892 domain-containing protein [Bacteroidetes bacterium]|nr:DUF2892 domain-containing protein [Bacteroidota bacterium]MBS1640626.1 DUF2892 domain-containing protein [Bacteroidota bacterium]MBS1643189.1 DUF2892 domain-containing protein [Bacteroidota bacterium]MBS1671365.1 DUF2892 domain-containing protein [Bacteroidota bacterium]